MSKWRYNLVFALLAGALLALAGRVVHLQLRYGSRLSKTALRQQRRVVSLPARPGNIYARSRGGYVLLAAARQVPSIYADPVFIGEEGQLAAAARKAAPALGVSAERLFCKMYNRRFRRFAYLLRDVTGAQEREAGRLRVPGIKLTYEWRRSYPRGRLGAHVLGHRQTDGAAGAGIELKADHWLKSHRGSEVVYCDAARRGRYARVGYHRPPRDGKHVALTLDVVIQGFLEEALATAVERFSPAGAMGVVMDPNTGKVLAMASHPSYDPNDYGRASNVDRRNRALTDPYEPGSAFKPFIAIGAIQMGRASVDTPLFCHHGLYRAHRGGTIRDFPGERFGTIPLSEVVIHSSNIGMAKLGERLGNETLARIARAFGFGRRTAVDLPGECPGKLVPTRKWTSYATRRMPFGQGPIMVTVLQLANAFSAIANGGVLLRPWIVDRVLKADGEVVYRGRPHRVHRVLDPAVARQFIDEVLVQVVERGTGKKCRLRRWRAFGKTGTGQIAGPQGYIPEAYTATFVAGAPANRPAVVCAISVYRPDYAKGHTGGTVSAPAVRGVLKNALAYLDVPPDKFETVAAQRPVR